MKKADYSHVRSETYAFLANALRFPDTNGLRILLDAEYMSAWKKGIHDQCPALSAIALELETRLAQYADSAGTAHRVLEESFIKLFGHTVRGVCPPYESEYGKAQIIQQASDLADIQGFYEAFGLRLVDGSHERIDHACVECEFMSVMAAKQAYAIMQGNMEARQVLHDAQAAFLEDHLGRWFIAFSRRLQDADENGFYGNVGKLADKFIQSECTRFGASCGPKFLQLKILDPENDCCMQCGVEQSCPGAEQSA